VLQHQYCITIPTTTQRYTSLSKCLWIQGLIRNLPIVGSIVGWLSPMKLETQGKAFDICSSSLMDVEFSPPRSRNKPPAVSTPLTSNDQLPPVEPLPFDILRDIEASPLKIHPPTPPLASAATPSTPQAQQQVPRTPPAHTTAVLPEATTPKTPIQ
jgi:hypothetical protein